MPKMIFKNIHFGNGKGVGNFIAPYFCQEGDITEEDGRLANDIDIGAVNFCFFGS